MTSPSQGTRSPASTSTTLPRAQLVRGLRVVPAAVPRLFQPLRPHLLAHAAQRVRLRLAASFGDRLAKLANSTVNHSHSATAPMNAAGASPWPRSASIHSQVVSRLPMKTTNITGLRA